ALIGHHRFGKLGGESLVSAITETPASGPAGPVTTPPRSLSPMSIAMPASSAREDTTAVATSAAVAIAAAHRSKACMGRFVINDDLLLGPGAQVDQVGRLLDQHLHAALLPQAALDSPSTASKLARSSGNARNTIAHAIALCLKADEARMKLE